MEQPAGKLILCCWATRGVVLIGLFQRLLGDHERLIEHFEVGRGEELQRNQMRHPNDFFNFLSKALAENSTRQRLADLDPLVEGVQFLLRDVVGLFSYHSTQSLF